MKKCILRLIGKPLAAFNVQSLDGFLARLLLSDQHLTDWDPLEAPGAVYKIIRVALLVTLAGATAWALWRAQRVESKLPSDVSDRARVAVMTEFWAVTCLAILISPISWSHYYLMLLGPCALWLGDRFAAASGGRRPWPLLFAACVALISPPVILSVPDDPLARVLVARIWLSHYFLGGVLMLALLLAMRRRLTSARAPAPCRA
jgi:hypothetical protein